MKQTKAKTPAKSSKSSGKSVAPTVGAMTMYEKLKASCPCDSGMSYVECCGKGEMCPCGSGKSAYECCFKSPQTHPM